MKRGFRLFTNILFLAVGAAFVVVVALINLVGGVLFDDTYLIKVPMPEAGGVLPQHEVTVLGHGVGQVADVQLTAEGVLLALSIRGDEHVPQQASVQVLRRSPLGEQTVNFVPESADWEAAERDATVVPVRATVPSQVPVLLDRAERLFSAVDPAELGTVVHEFALAFRGRGETLTQLNRESLALNETLVGGIPEFRRLIDTSEPVLALLDEQREELADLFANSADLSEVLAENRPTLETILDRSPQLLNEVDALIRNTQANLACFIVDFRDLNAHVAQPTELEDLAMLLDLNYFFYHAFDVVNQWDPYGRLWARINLILDQPAGGQPFVPHRPTPITKPGAACRSPFGVGVNAVRQADHQPPDPTSPGIDFAPLVDRPGSGGVVPPGATDPPGGGDPGGDDDDDGAPGGGDGDGDGSAGGDDDDDGPTGFPLPATGGGLSFVGVSLTLFGGWARWRRLRWRRSP